ncbi:TonB-dependent receptor plug domain-containing protein, partial [Candidatus Poribacteria bacterium]|nr:TonB-dependent receptor plug domain-containing protein [Candidatus Poribacteria bacterium]
MLPVLAATTAAETVLDDVVVTSGQSATAGGRTTTRHTVTRHELRGFPHLGEDVFRAVARVPGIATDEYAAQFSIRGGEEDEILVWLDGMELYEPFHLKDVNGGALSILDVEAVGDIDIMTGAFPARFGDRLSGVLDMTSSTPSQDGGRTSLGLSMTNARLLSEGRLKDGRGHWLFVARRGYLDLVLGITDASPQVDLRPVYYDTYGKIAFQVGESQSMSAHALWAADTMTIVDDEDTVDNSYGNGYGWLTWAADVGSDARQRTVLSAGRVTRDRLGVDLSGSGGRLNSEVSEDRVFDLLGIKQEWTMSPSDPHMLSAG